MRFSGTLPIEVAPRDGSKVRLIGIYEGGWTAETVCWWNVVQRKWEGWDFFDPPTHLVVSNIDAMITRILGPETGIK